MALRQLEDAKMARKRHTAEEIVAKLRQGNVLTAQGRPVAEAVRAIGVSEVTYRDELLDGEVFHSLAEAEVVIEGWRRHHNSDRPHSALGYRPPAPEVVLWPAPPTTQVVAPKPLMH
jgi:transposase InsO family protein